MHMEVVVVGCEGGWGVQNAYERNLLNLGIKGEGLAVGVVTEVGFTEET